MTLASLHKWTSYLYAFLGLAALGLGDQLGPSSLGLLLSGLVITWFVEGPILDRRGYARAWNVAALAVVAAQVFRGVFLEAPPLTLAIELVGFLQLSRLASRRSAVEYRQIAALGFLHLIAATILSTDVEYGLLFFGFVVATPWMLALTHFRAEIEAFAGASAGSVVEAAGRTRPIDARALRERAAPLLESRGVVGPGFLLGIASLAIPLFFATAALFLVFPRVGMGFLSFGAEEGQRVAGFGDDVRLGGFGVIRDDPSIVLRVTPPTLPDDAPRFERFRLRGTSFDRYDAGRWTRTPDAGRRVPNAGQHFPIVPPSRDGPSTAHYGIVLNALDQPVLFLPEGTVAVELAPRMVQGLPVARRLVARRGFDVRYEDGDGLDVVYTAIVEEPPRGLVEPLTPEARALYLALPRGQERIAELARRVAGNASAPDEIAARIEAYLRDSGELAYSLEQPDTRGRDPLEVFLFEARRGHCEYYSSAMAVMLRALGVPARNVTGFLGGELNPYGRYYAIRNGDAHSWVEAHVGDRWKTYDPTPPAPLAAAAHASSVGEVRAFLDAIRVHWARYVVGYDLRSQVGLVRGALAFFRSVRPGGGSARRDELAAGAPSVRLSVRARAAGLGLALALLVAGFAALAFRRASRAREPEAVRLARALEVAMARLGWPRPPHESPSAWAESLRREGAPFADLAVEVIEAYAEARYRSRPVDRARAAALWARVRRLPRIRTRRGASAR